MRLSLRDVGRLTATALTITTAWICAGLFFAWQHHTIILARKQPDDLQERMVGMMAAMFAWALFTPFVVWISDLLPLRKPLRARNTLLIAVVACVIAFARAVVDAALPALLADFPLTFVDYRASVLALFHTHLLFTLVVIGIANFLRLEREEKERRHASARLESQLAQARLRQLSADLHPHFLFNALN
ncbi:MAG TPA: hypothetical protein VE010_21275, partial [Thermoanaerobaculia bacterium]|nr:hypothetical protein [Thermoanaerobaculia bacterium]